MRERHAAGLRTVDLFRGCTDAELRWIGRTGDELLLPAGSVLARRGTRGRQLVVLLEGRAEGDERSYEAGSAVGALELVDDGPVDETVVASTDVRLLVFGVRGFASLVGRCPTVARKLLRDLAGRVRDVDASATLSAAS